MNYATSELNKIGKPSKTLTKKSLKFQILKL